MQWIATSSMCAGRSSISGCPTWRTGRSTSLPRNDRAIEREIETALRAYEPRLAARRPSGSNATRSSMRRALKLRYVIRADLSCRPVDIPVEFTAEVEIDSGKVVVNRL